MFDIIGFIVETFIYVWIFIIASVPNAFMGGLTICIVATVLTYFLRDKQTD